MKPIHIFVAGSFDSTKDLINVLQKSNPEIGETYLNITHLPCLPDVASSENKFREEVIESSLRTWKSEPSFSSRKNRLNIFQAKKGIKLRKKTSLDKILNSLGYRKEKFGFDEDLFQVPRSDVKEAQRIFNIIEKKESFQEEEKTADKEMDMSNIFIQRISKLEDIVVTVRKFGEFTCGFINLPVQQALSTSGLQVISAVLNNLMEEKSPFLCFSYIFSGIRTQLRDIISRNVEFCFLDPLHNIQISQDIRVIPENGSVDLKSALNVLKSIGIKISSHENASLKVGKKQLNLSVSSASDALACLIPIFLSVAIKKMSNPNFFKNFAIDGSEELLANSMSELSSCFGGALGFSVADLDLIQRIENTILKNKTFTFSLSESMLDIGSWKKVLQLIMSEGRKNGFSFDYCSSLLVELSNLEFFESQLKFDQVENTLSKVKEHMIKRRNTEEGQFNLLVLRKKQGFMSYRNKILHSSSLFSVEILRTKRRKI
eukprot:snap_masked-scaffold_26-processed-gene-0.18-mRNA-1 protein AED:1.00 eAED:1.00 QI:0/0/0/0/1/1/3/0/487